MCVPDVTPEMWDRFEGLNFWPLFFPLLFSHDPSTSRIKATYPRNHYDKQAASASPTGFYSASGPHIHRRACDNRCRYLKDLLTRHLLNKKVTITSQRSSTVRRPFYSQPCLERRAPSRSDDRLMLNSPRMMMYDVNTLLFPFPLRCIMDHRVVLLSLNCFQKNRVFPREET